MKRDSNNDQSTVNIYQLEWTEWTTGDADIDDCN